MGSPLPSEFAEFADGWRRLHPDWEYRLWGEDLPKLRNQDLYDRAQELAPTGLAGQLRSDIVRYELIYKYGGVWIDTDFECLKPVDGLLEGVSCFAAWVTDQWLNNAIMGARARHPFIKRLIDNLPASLASRPGQAPRVVSGPQYLTRQWREAKPDISLWPKEYAYPYLWNELGRRRDRFPDAYCVHHWANRRRERGRPL